MSQLPAHQASALKPPAQSPTDFSHVRPDDTGYVDQGLRDFFLYRDLGIADATHGKVLVQLVKANLPPEQGTGWHRHVADFHIVLMLKGWARFMYEDQETLVAAGDCVHQRPGITHYLFDYSPDMEYLEIVGPADFQTIDAPAPCDVPAVTPWPQTAQQAWRDVAV
ncbi:Mannose-6-phosphate isomerase, cupin superfamily [Cupriavidus sp. YR651]|uniref:cupin domain-containing protein n=1 Tax=Cupriavidus sp. YR651 TaxID=1855315 RepID=UPI00088CF63B|nr:cupin domain-containing protein [Cupriavidus sp. YR651]SDC21122.1 Mannose-6-phosphate isomerase, cupin superfamily [Cupriavidus sp. YR651]